MRWPTVPEPNWMSERTIMQVGSLQMSTCGADSQWLNLTGLDGFHAGCAFFSDGLENKHLGPESGLHNEETAAAT